MNRLQINVIEYTVEYIVNNVLLCLYTILKE